MGDGPENDFGGTGVGWPANVQTLPFGTSAAPVKYAAAKPAPVAQADTFGAFDVASEWIKHFDTMS